MVKVTFDINGQSITPGSFGDVFEATILETIENEVRAKLAGIRDPDTGEFPVVSVIGSTLENLSFEVEGSPKLVSLVQEALDHRDEEGTNEMIANAPTTDKNTENSTPCVFLSHASEDKELARRIAGDFQRQGINTFLDEWEIGPGDSLREKIDASLEQCTHFVVLITSCSIQKRWVTAEINAGFVQKVSGECKFIPLRHDYPAEHLPPLLRSLYSPSLEDYGRNINTLINNIHGITRKPPLGIKPQIIRQSSQGAIGLSATAEAIARLMIEQSEHGNSFDPEIEVVDIRQKTGLDDDDIVDGVDELVGRGLVRKKVFMGCGPIGFGSVISEAALFVALDKYFKDWDPAVDALRIAADLVNGAVEGIVSAIADEYDWLPRRMNPAVNYLVERDVVNAGETTGTHPWCYRWISKKDNTRRFVRDRS